MGLGEWREAPSQIFELKQRQLPAQGVTHDVTSGPAQPLADPGQADSQLTVQTDGDNIAHVIQCITRWFTAQGPRRDRTRPPQRLPYFRKSLSIADGAARTGCEVVPVMNQTRPVSRWTR